MQRRYRVVLSVAATAGLVGGVGAAVGAVPAKPLVAKSSGLSTRASGNPARKAEAAWLKAQLAGTSADDGYLRAQIARLEVAVVRAQRARALELRALGLRQHAQEVARQRAALAMSLQAAASRPSYAPSQRAPRLAVVHSPARRVARPVSAVRSPAPPTHARTGASGAPATTSDHENDDSGHESGGSDD